MQGNELAGIRCSPSTRVGQRRVEKSSLVNDQRIFCSVCGHACDVQCQQTNQNEYQCLQRNRERGNDMDLPGLMRCYEQSESSFFRDRCKGYLPSKIFEDMGPTTTEQAIPSELMNSYCKMIKELKRCREELSYLRKERNDLETELNRNRKDLEAQRKLIDSERQRRKGIQDKLRKLADEYDDCPMVNSDYSVTTKWSSGSAEADIEFYKDQFRVYQEDFKLEKEENIKLRTLNTQLTNELEEAKQMIESQEKKLLVYAHVFSSGNGSQAVLPPAFIGRKVHSNPTTPSYSQGPSFGATTRPYFNAYDTRDVRQTRKPTYDPITDIVPKGITEEENLQFDFSRKQSFSDGEIDDSLSNTYKRRTNSII